MNARLIMLAVALVAIAGFAVGCGDEDEPASAGSANGGTNGEAVSGDGAGGSGGDGESGDTATVQSSSLDKEEFIKKASAACTRERKGLLNEIGAYLKKHEPEGKPQGLLFAQMVKAVLLPMIEAEVAAIRELGAPSGDEEEVEAILAAQEQGIEEAKQLKRLESLEEVEAHFIPATERLFDYGFETCNNSPTP